MSKKAFSRLAWWLRHEIADAAGRLEFPLINDGHAVANGFHLPNSCDEKEHRLALVFPGVG